jgi:hypothetical protein
MKPIHDVFAVAKQGHHLAALLGVILALAGFANAANSHKSKTGSLTIAVPTEVGGVVLQPGDYEVREINSASGAAVEFVRLFDNLVASEGMPIYDEEVVAEVPFTGQALSAAPKQTQLRLAPDKTRATALEIRGNAVDYLFQNEKSGQDYASK